MRKCGFATLVFGPNFGVRLTEISRALRDYNAMARSMSGSGRTGPPLTGVLQITKYDKVSDGVMI